MTANESPKERVISQFSRTAQAYVTSTSHGNPAALERVVQTLAPKSDWTVLDVATGGGHVAKAVSPHVRQVVACDLTKRMLEVARAHLSASGHANVTYVIGDAEALPFLDASFDAVTCRIAPHHFPNPQTFVTEVSRILKPGGRFLLVDNIAPESHELAAFYNDVESRRDTSHVRCPSESEWRAWFVASQLEVLTAETSWKWFEFSTWVHRTVEDEETIAEIEKLLMDGDAQAKSFFRVMVADGRVESFSGLEWMALVEKKVEV